MISRQAQVLARGSAMFLQQQNKGMVPEAALVPIVSASGWAVLHFP